MGGGGMRAVVTFAARTYPLSWAMQPNTETLAPAWQNCWHRGEETHHLPSALEERGECPLLLQRLLWLPWGARHLPGPLTECAT